LRAGNQNEGLIVIAVLAAILIVAVGSLGVLLVLMTHRAPARTASANPKPSPGPVSRTTQLSASSGDLVFMDDFQNPATGWNTVSGAADVTYAYSNGAYVVVAKGNYNYYSPAPYYLRPQQISASVTATLGASTPSDAGFGMDCDRGAAEALVTYEFTADVDGRWSVDRAIGDTASTIPTLLVSGSLGSAPAPGTVPVTLVGICATQSDGQTARLVFFIDGKKVTDIIDNTATSSGRGWAADLVTSASDSGPVTVTVTRFELRDLSRSGP
jgi:hypothetical protein